MNITNSSHNLSTENNTSEEKYKFVSSEEIQQESESWNRFRDLLRTYMDKGGVSQKEIADGLNLSRSVISEFIPVSSNTKPKRNRLNIKRISLYNFWNHITNPDTNKGEEYIKFRQQLKLEGPDKLFKTLGYFIYSSNYLSISHKRQQQIKRVVAALDSSNLNNSDFLDIIEDIEPQILKALENNSDTNKKGVDKYFTIQECKQKASDFLNSIRSIDSRTEEKIFEKLNRFLNKLARKGKKKLAFAEWFYLLTSIVDKELNNSLQNVKLDGFLRIQNCQFQAIDFLLTDYLQKLEQPNNIKSEEKSILQKKIEKAIKNSERLLRSFDNQEEEEGEEEFDKLLDILSPMLETEVNCILSKSKKKFNLSYCSCSTPLSNLVAAIEFGMGFATYLNPSIISIRSLTNTVDGMVRCSVVLQSNSNQKNRGHERAQDLQQIQYQGIWVDSDTITSSGQAFVCAAQNWIIDHIANLEELQNYYNIVEQLANIEKRLKDRVKTVYDHQIWKLNEIENLEGLLVYINSKKSEWKKNFPRLYELFETSINCLYQTTVIKLARHNNIRGNIVQTNNLLQTKYWEDIDNRSTIEQQLHIQYLHDAEEKIYNLSVGKKELNSKINWTELDHKIKKLGSFCLSNKTNDNLYSQYFSFDAYLCASELCGSYARTAFYSKNNSMDLEKALNKLLEAAHYSSRIGLVQKTSRWLSMAARVSCRLRKKELTSSLIKISKLIYSECTQEIKEEYIKSIESELEIAIGEFCLLEHDYREALIHFIKALTGAALGRFSRRVIDALYNIYRAISKGKFDGEYLLNESYFSFYQSIEAIIKNFNQDRYNQTKSDENINNIFHYLVKFCRDFQGNYENIQQESCENIQKRFKKQAVLMLDKWHNTTISGNHIFSEAINNNSFLAPIEID